eukprot:8549_1
MPLKQNMLNLVALLLITTYLSAGRELSDEVGEAKALCQGSYGNKFDSLQSNMNTVLTSIDTTINTNKDTCISIIGSVNHELENIISRSNDLVPLKQECLDISNTIKELIQDVTNLINQALTFAELMDEIESNISTFEANVNITNNAIKSDIIGGVIDLNSIITNKFTELNTYLDYSNGVPFPSLEVLISDALATQTPTIKTSLTTIQSNTDTKFKGESRSINNNIETQFDALNKFVLEVQSAIQSFIILEKQTVNGARDNMKWDLGLKIDYGSSANAKKLVIDKNDDGLFIEVRERDLYIIATVVVAMNFVWIGMVVYMIVYCCDVNTLKSS